MPCISIVARASGIPKYETGTRSVCGKVAETWRVATPKELKDPLMVLLDLALGSGWPIDRTPNPSIMKVDYVHVFAPPTDGAATGGGCND